SPYFSSSPFPTRRSSDLLPDLSAPDPIFILPVILGISMFLLQWIGMRSMPDPNPQLKMMMWFMPIMMMFIFYRLAAGLNLYYARSEEHTSELQSPDQLVC